MYFFRERIENAYKQSGIGGNNGRLRRGKNDTIFDRLPEKFNYEDACRMTSSIKGVDCSQNAVRQMLRNWDKQGLITIVGPMKYQKVSA